MIVYHIHHIIPKHKWKKLYGSLEGVNTPSNLKKLTIRQHSLAHKKLWETNGYWEDKVAWQRLSEQITNAEATKEAQRLANIGNTHGLGYKHTETFKKKMSAFKKIDMIGRKNALGHIVSPEARKRLAETSRGNTNRRGKKCSQATKDQMSAAKALTWKITDPKGKSSVIQSLSRFCVDHPGLNKERMFNTVKTGLPYKGYTVARL